MQIKTFGKKYYLTEESNYRPAHYNSHSEPIFKKLNILKISDQYELDGVLFMNKFQNKKNFQLPSMTCSGTTMRSRHLILPDNQNKFIWKYTTLSFLVNYLCIIFLFSGIDIGGDNLHDQMSHSMLRRLVKSNFIDSYVEVVNCQNSICRDCGSAQ